MDVMTQPDPPDSRDRPPGQPPQALVTIAAGAVTIHDGRVLLVRNRYGVTKGRYLLPAGRAEPGEAPDVTAVRETFEETNLKIAIEGLLGVRLWIADDEQNYFFMFRAQLVSPVTDLVANLAEIDDARLFSLAELDALGPEETWLGAVAIARKGLLGQAEPWRNDPGLSRRSGVELIERWRLWL